MLRLNELSVGFTKEKSVLQNVNIAVQNSNEITALIGINGSGKTSLLKTMIGLLPKLSGEITLGDRPFNNFSRQERSKRISFLESENSVLYPMTVKELLEISLRNHLQKNIYAAALEALNLEHLEKKNLLELSSGEVKRAFIAHTLCSCAEIILLDEPLAHLDWSHQQFLVTNLKKWRDEFHTTFVLAIHELDWVVKLSDRVIALGQGRVLIQNAPKLVLESVEVGEVFAFQARIDENPIDGSERLTLGKKTHDARKTE